MGRSDLHKDLIERVIAQVAASYVSRELDLRWLDKLADTCLGRNLRGLPSSSKYALEFLAYLGAAFVAHSNPNPSAFRLFLNQVLADIPPEIAKRMMEANAPVDPTVLKAVVLGITDQELVEVLAFVKPEASATNSDALDPISLRQSPLGRLADKINKSRQHLRNRAWRQKK